MRKTHSFVLICLAMPLVLVPLLGCPELGIGTRTGAGGGGLFNLPPTVVLGSNVQRGVTPLVVQFNSSGSTDDGVIIERLWDFGDGTTSPEIAPSHTYRQTGEFTVRLTLTDEQGATASRAILVSVTERPVAVVQVDRTAADSAPATFDFDGGDSYDPDDPTAVDESRLRYRWDFGDGSIEVAPSVPHTFATPGTYRVVLTVTDAVGVTGTDEVVISVGIPTPTIAFRKPSADVVNIVCNQDCPLWIHTVFEVEPGVPRFLSAGLDEDNDPCDSRAAVYDADSRAVLDELTGHEEPVRAVAISPDARTIVTGADDGNIRLSVYNDATESWLFTRGYAGDGGACTSLAFAPDGTRFAAGFADRTAIVYDATQNSVAAGRIGVFVGHLAGVNAVALSPDDGGQLVSGDSFGTAILWDVAGAAELRRFEHPDATIVTSVAFDPRDPRQILTGALDQTARLWSASTGLVLQDFVPEVSGGVVVSGHSGAITCVGISNDGSRVVTGSSDTTAILWDADTGAELEVFAGHGDGVNAIAFSQDDSQTRIVTGSSDGTARIWDLRTGNYRTLQPCLSPISAVAFSPPNDGREVVVLGVAARNEIRLNTTPSSGNDLNLTIPTALDLSDVPFDDAGREYFLWAEIDTDRSEPSRTYADAIVTVIPPYHTPTGGTIDAAATPQIPYLPVVDSSGAERETANIVMPPSTNRQVVNLGPLDFGDRIFLSLMTLPGYGQIYAEDGFSLLILEMPPAGDPRLYAWYQDGRVLFSPNSKLIVRSAGGSNHYLVMDSTGGLVPSLNIQIQRQLPDEDIQPRGQLVYLNFNDETIRGLSVADSAIFQLDPFDLTADGYNNANVQNAVLTRVETLFQDYDFAFTTTEPDDATQPRQTIYFDTTERLLTDASIFAAQLDFYGLTNYADPRNETLTGRAVIGVAQIIDAFPGLSNQQLGVTVGNAVAHHVGLLSGLHETVQPGVAPDDIMISDSTEVTSELLLFTTADLAPALGIDPIGEQDADALLRDVFGGR